MLNKQNKYKKIGYIAISLLISALIVSVPAYAATWNVGAGEDFDDIIDALASENVVNGDILLLKTGTHEYNSNVSISKSVKIKGNGAENTIIEFGNYSFLPKVQDIEIKDITINNAAFGVATQGTSDGLVIENCVFTNLNHKDGIKLVKDNAVFKNNVVSDMAGFTTVLNVTGNSVIIENNKFENNIGAGTASRVICLENATNPTVSGNEIRNNDAEGIRLWKIETSNGLFTQNEISGNTKGIVLYGTGPGNKIYANDIHSNVNDVTVAGTLQTDISWSSDEVQEYTYNGVTHNSNIGNYWSESASIEDSDNNGIGDTVYTVVETLVDNYPLKQSFVNYVSRETGSIEPTEPSEPVDPEPTEPVDPEPTEPNEPVDPEPTEPNEPVDPEPTEPIQYEFESGEISLNATILPAIEVTFSTSDINFGDIRPGGESAPYGVDIINHGIEGIVVTAEVTEDSDEIYKSGLQIDKNIWSDYSKQVGAEQTETSYFVLKVPRDYSGVSNPTGDVILWIDTI